jgi:hypothetical protein
MARAQLACQIAGVVSIVEPDVIDAPSRLPQFRGKMTHGREDEGEFLFVMPHIACLDHDLGHQHDVPLRIARAQGGQRGRQLVAKNEDEARFHVSRARRLPSHREACPLGHSGCGAGPFKTECRKNLLLSGTGCLSPMRAIAFVDTQNLTQK